MKRIFISDLHLDEAREDLTLAYERFLREKATEADELYILGDFFEVWLGDDHDTPFNRRVIAALAALPCRKYIMHGNRDFLIGEAFCRAAGATLLSDPTRIGLGTTPALLMHGDSLCTMDEQYMKVRALFRSHEFQADFLSKPLAEREAFARQIRGESREHQRETADDIMDVTPGEVDRVMQEAGAPVLIHGHTHRPAEHTHAPGRRIVLGDWETSTCYLVAEDDKLDFIHWQF